MSESLRRKLLWSAWFVSIALALICMTVFAQGIARDRRIGEPVLRIDLSSPSAWISVPFRVWGAGRYTLFVSSVNHDPQHVGVPLAGDFEVSIAKPDGKLLFHRLYAAGSTDHALPANYADSKLANFDLDGWPFRDWTLKARVLKPDPRFKTARTEIKFWKERYDPGMGGLMNYVMILPAGLFLVLSFLASLALAARGFRSPVIATSISGLALVGFFLV